MVVPLFWYIMWGKGVYLDPCMEVQCAIGTVEETPLTCTITIADLPWLAMLNHTAQAVACGRAENFTCLKVISPMLCGRKRHNRYLSVFNSEEAQAGGLAPLGVPLTSVSILYHILRQKSRGLSKFLCELYVTYLWTMCELWDRDCGSKVYIFKTNNLQIVNKSFKRSAAGDRGPPAKLPLAAVGTERQEEPDTRKGLDMISGSQEACCRYHERSAAIDYWSSSPCIPSLLTYILYHICAEKSMKFL